MIRRQLGRLCAATALCLGFTLAAGAAQDSAPAEGSAAVVDKTEGLLRVERGEGLLPLLIPRDEELNFNVRVSFGWFGDPKIGTVVMRSKVEPHRGSALVTNPSTESLGERAELSAFAKGGNSMYMLEELRSTMILPQSWPHIVHRSTQTGTENRKREQHIGTGPKGKKHFTRFRADGHCWGCDLQQHFVEGTWAWQDPRHCPKCKRGEHRLWRDWQQRRLPEGALDMVSAVTLGRSMMLLDVEEVRFPLIDEEELWDLHIRRGETRRVDVDAGDFEASEILLETKPAAGEDAKDEDFQGLFGIHGTVSIWFDTKTGVPVLISGSIPLGPLTLHVEVQLTSYRGTPAGFAPLP